MFRLLLWPPNTWLSRKSAAPSDEEPRERAESRESICLGWENRGLAPNEPTLRAERGVRGVRGERGERGLRTPSNACVVVLHQPLSLLVLRRGMAGMGRLPCDLLLFSAPAAARAVCPAGSRSPIVTKWHTHTTNSERQTFRLAAFSV